jgi:hypothetical protein
MEERSHPRPEDEERGKQNELGFYNADEDETYNERGGTQGEPPGDEVAEEITDKP